MTGLFANAIIVVSLVLAVWAFVLAAMGRSASIPLVAGVGVLELMLIAFFIGGIVQMISTTHDFAKWEFVAYLLGLCVIPPLGVAWSWGEKSRTAMIVIGVALLVVPIMVVRVQQVWSGTSVTHV